MSKPYIPFDKFSKKARDEDYRARSVYKLEELDYKYHIIKQDQHVLDVGAAPGSWLQYVSEKIGPSGHVLGLDIQEIEPVADNVTTKIADITNDNEIEKALGELGWEKVDLVLSDIAPSTTGIASLDHGRSIDMSTIIYKTAKKFLKPGGKLVMKVFDGGSFPKFVSDLRKEFKKVIVTKSHASRERSKEMYIVCQ